MLPLHSPASRALLVQVTSAVLMKALVALSGRYGT
jgi:hypothetical protein